MMRRRSTSITHTKTGKMAPLEEPSKPHCLILPHPVQGHINPMLQFAKRLHHKGIKVTLALTKYIAKTSPFSSDTISLETYSDGFDDGNPPITGIDEYLARYREVGPRTLREVLERLADSGEPVGCMVYDPLLTWALDLAKGFGLMVAALFTQSCAVGHIYHQVYKGELKVPVSGQEVLVPGLPKLEPKDLPSFVSEYGLYPSVFELVVGQFKGIEKADWIFYNTFYKLEQEVIDYMAKSSPVKAIGPAIPSMYLDKWLLNDKEYGLSVYEPIRGPTMDWLNEQLPESVIYISFGSLALLGEEQMEELAWGLRLSNKPFLWVVRSSEQSKLPKDFAEESSKKGLIVSWCPQLDVLAHEAVCCFVTHCGWNSTLEALSLGVPMVAIPQWTDQGMNSKFVADVWKMGVRACVGENGVVGRETIADCIREVVEGKRAGEIKKNVVKWKELAREAMVEGGNSDKNIDEFVSSLRLNSLGSFDVGVSPTKTSL